MRLPSSILQTLRKAHVALWRLSRMLYWNAHPGTQVPIGSRIAPTVRIELETGGTVRLGQRTQLCHYAILCPHGGSIEIGSRVYIGSHCVIFGHGGTRIGDDTLIAPHVVIVPMSHDYEDAHRPIREQGETRLGVIIGRDCWIGAGVKILDGVSIGDGCVIGAGSVVRESLAARSIAVGVPARVIGQRGLLSVEQDIRFRRTPAVTLAT